MNRPNAPGFDELDAMLTDVREMDEAIKNLRLRLQEMPKLIASQLDAEADRIQAARYLYWMVKEIRPTAISEALVGVPVNALHPYIGTVSGLVECDKCGTPLQFRSRSHMQSALRKVRTSQRKGYANYAEGYTIICDECWQSLQHERTAQWQKEQATRDARLNALRTMPYREYLQTAEWLARRKQHVKSAGYRCQVCNASGVQLNVHHRTYERRGNEYYKDLLALCRNCHEIFHREGKLADD
jgi:5-methylcytosine-specific restriction endonuclease McrA